MRKMPHHVNTKAMTEGNERKAFEDDNARVIETFLRETAQNLMESRKTKYRLTLGKLGRVHFGKELRLVTRQELENFIERLNNDDLEEEYMSWTKHDYRLFAKKFFSWLHKKDDPEFASWIKIVTVEPTVEPEDILTEQELQCILSTCTSLRDKALIASLYETAVRPHELLGLRICDISFEDYEKSATVYIRKGKAGARAIPIVGDAGAYLADWRAHHPKEKSFEHPLWVDMTSNTRYEALHYQGLKRLIERIVYDGAKLKKRVTPYTFRHTRLTDLARRGFTESQLCEFAGWKQGSEMPRMYPCSPRRKGRAFQGGGNYSH
jgi:integrase/recombinase XerD